MDHDVLHHVNMTIHPGEKVAIVGENGAGKTTFVKLLMRLYDVTGGSICFGGDDVRNYTTTEYRDKIGAVFQDYQIYAGTLRENVCMEPDSPFSDEEICAALHQADFSSRLATLPNGLDTILTREFDNKGVNLSGGESQKVAISRMFIRTNHHAVSILDEPSSALDPVSEYHLNENMIQNAKDSTILFISHRLSTTRMADHIYLFDHGTIKEHGTHDDLMELGGQYRKMFDRQAKYYKLDRLSMENKS
jgi:ATP-binding cassette subfamily B protein